MLLTLTFSIYNRIYKINFYLLTKNTEEISEIGHKEN